MSNTNQTNNQNVQDWLDSQNDHDISNVSLISQIETDAKSDTTLEQLDSTLDTGNILNHEDDPTSTTTTKSTPEHETPITPAVIKNSDLASMLQSDTNQTDSNQAKKISAIFTCADIRLNATPTPKTTKKSIADLQEKTESVFSWGPASIRAKYPNTPKRYYSTSKKTANTNPNSNPNSNSNSNPNSNSDLKTITNKYQKPDKESGCMSFYWLKDGSIYWNRWLREFPKDGLRQYRHGTAFTINERIRVAPNAADENFSKYLPQTKKSEVKSELIRGSVVLLVQLPKKFAPSFIGPNGQNLTAIHKIEGAIYTHVSSCDCFIFSSVNLELAGIVLRLVCKCVINFLPQLDQDGAPKVDILSEIKKFLTDKKVKMFKK